MDLRDRSMGCLTKGKYQIVYFNADFCGSMQGPWVENASLVSRILRNHTSPECCSCKSDSLARPQWFKVCR